MKKARKYTGYFRELTKDLSAYAPLLTAYHDIIGEYDFIRAKAKLAIDMRGNYPLLYG